MILILVINLNFFKNYLNNCQNKIFNQIQFKILSLNKWQRKIINPKLFKRLKIQKS